MYIKSCLETDTVYEKMVATSSDLKNFDGDEIHVVKRFAHSSSSSSSSSSMDAASCSSDVGQEQKKMLHLRQNKKQFPLLLRASGSLCALYSGVASPTGAAYFFSQQVVLAAGTADDPDSNYAVEKKIVPVDVVPQRSNLRRRGGRKNFSGTGREEEVGATSSSATESTSTLSSTTTSRPNLRHGGRLKSLLEIKQKTTAQKVLEEGERPELEVVGKRGREELTSERIFIPADEVVNSTQSISIPSSTLEKVSKISKEKTSVGQQLSTEKQEEGREEQKFTLENKQTLQQKEHRREQIARKISVWIAKMSGSGRMQLVMLFLECKKICIA